MRKNKACFAGFSIPVQWITSVGRSSRKCYICACREGIYLPHVGVFTRLLSAHAQKTCCVCSLSWRVAYPELPQVCANYCYQESPSYTRYATQYGREVCTCVRSEKGHSRRQNTLTNRMHSFERSMGPCGFFLPIAVDALFCCASFPFFPLFF